MNIVLCTFLNKFELPKNNHNLFFLKKKLGIKVNFLNNENKNFGYLLNWLLYKIKSADLNSNFITKVISKLVIILNKLSILFNKKKINKKCSTYF